MHTRYGHVDESSRFFGRMERMIVFHPHTQRVLHASNANECGFAAIETSLLKQLTTRAIDRRCICVCALLSCAIDGTFTFVHAYMLSPGVAAAYVHASWEGDKQCVQCTANTCNYN